MWILAIKGLIRRFHKETFEIWVCTTISEGSFFEFEHTTIVISCTFKKYPNAKFIWLMIFAHSPNGCLTRSWVNLITNNARADKKEILKNGIYFKDFFIVAVQLWGHICNDTITSTELWQSEIMICGLFLLIFFLTACACWQNFKEVEEGFCEVNDKAYGPEAANNNKT